MISSLLQLRRTLYRGSFLSSVKVDCPVVSVGNLSMGGSGKTPLIEALLTALKAKNIRGQKIVVVSRNYKAESRGMHWVDLSKIDAARFFGDEPVLIKSLHPDVNVLVGPSKSNSAVRAFQEKSPSLILVDDGFQHRRLQRDLDVVLMSEGDVEESVFPFGYLRESLSALSEAHWVVLNSQSNVEVMQKFQKQIQEKVQTSAQFTGVVGELDMDATLVNKSKRGWAAFAGIARPQRFFKSLELKLGRPAEKTWVYSDHHSYTEKSFEEIMKWKAANSSLPVFTTEKDMVKLKELPVAHSDFHSVKWRFQRKGIEGVVHDICRIVEEYRS